jgi:hypothetical protein
VATGLIYLFVVIWILRTAQTRFETLVLACLAQIYAATLFNFSAIGSANHANNLGAIMRFRILAKGQGQTATEDGLVFAEEEKKLLESSEKREIFDTITQVSHGLVSIYALYKIVAALIA